MSRYIQMYLSTTPDVIADLKTEFNNNNLEDLGLKAHSIKPQAQYMGISSLKEVLIRIETNIKNNVGIEDLEMLVEQADTLNKQAMSELQTFLNQS